MSLRDLHRIRSTLNSTTANTIGTSLIHSKVNYCNSLIISLPRFQLDRLQLDLNSAARAVTKTVSPQIKITDISFTHHAPVPSYALTEEFREPAIQSPNTIQLCFTTPPSLIEPPLNSTTSL